jgi:hypothetical protein
MKERTTQRRGKYFILIVSWVTLCSNQLALTLNVPCMFKSLYRIVKANLSHYRHGNQHEKIQLSENWTPQFDSKYYYFIVWSMHCHEVCWDSFAQLTNVYMFPWLNLMQLPQRVSVQYMVKLAGLFLKKYNSSACMSSKCLPILLCGTKSWCLKKWDKIPRF